MIGQDSSLYLWLIHAFLTWFMTGVIWFVQVVHYPLFSFVKREEFSTFEKEHTRRTTRVVALPMLFELGSASLLVAGLGPPMAMLWLWLNWGLVFVVFAVTFLIQVPCHRRLLDDYQPWVHRKLVLSNWLRTFLWSVRSLLVLWMTFRLGLHA